jgi:4-amino-4-deoxy-L-arabinose transferase-like glycosyltransferase
MMGLFYLLTLYASVRAHTSRHSTRWLVTAVLTSALGMACKQSMVTVPVAVVLIDRVFFSDSFADTLRRRWRFYTA